VNNIQTWKPDFKEQNNFSNFQNVHTLYTMIINKTLIIFNIKLGQTNTGLLIMKIVQLYMRVIFVQEKLGLLILTLLGSLNIFNFQSPKTEIIAYKQI
jgi:hypothetical protein